jgi:hypothetical protein
MTELGKQIYNTPPLTDACVIAHIWLSRGFGVLPVQPGSKSLVRGFGPFRGVINTAEDIEFWFRYRGANLAVVAPELSIILDFDQLQIYNQFAAAWPGLITSYSEATPRGGRHVWLKVLGSRPIIPDLVKGIEVKKFCLVHPSQIGGVSYEILEPGPILTISPDQLQEVLKPYHAPGGDKYQPSPVAPVLGACGPEFGLNKGLRQNHGIIARVKAAWPILNYLQYFEPKLQLEGRGAWRSGRCRWHPDHDPSLWVNVETNLFGCHACPAHGDVINWHALRLGTSDMVTAARDLDGYKVAFMAN